MWCHVEGLNLIQLVFVNEAAVSWEGSEVLYRFYLSTSGTGNSNIACPPTFQVSLVDCPAAELWRAM
jgi:hypothetical protein